MKKIVLLLFLLVTSFVWSEPHRTIGPVDEWVTNGRWLMKVKKVSTASDLTQLSKWPWKPDFSSAEGKELQSQIQRLVFENGGSLVMLRVEFKNPGDGGQQIGYETPSWVIRCDDGQEIRNTGAVPQGAARFLKDHLPALQSVPAGETLEGRMVFVLPKHRTPALLFFKAAPSMEKIAGKSETLVCRLGDSSKGVAPLKPNRPDAAWQSNPLWKMRVTDSRVVSTIDEYRALPWGSRLQGKDREKHFSYVERNVFNKGGRVALVTLEAKNLTEEKKEVGYEIPFWKLRCSDGENLRISGVYMQQIPWALAGGMPKRTLLNPNAIAGGTMGFFLGPDQKPVKLFFEVPGSLKKHYGESKSLQFEL